MTITWEYQGNTETVEFHKEDVLIGRGSEGDGPKPDLCLDFDPKASRRHARIWQEDDDYWLEDLDSRRGTLVNGHKLATIWGLTEKDVIVIGETTIRVSGLRVFKTMVLRPPTSQDPDEA
ncbi:MAG: FHA domain-containing protein [Verrucomicrobiae bacterium]|jgi:pSer/pThr/pTyr-binding forkhead associated (FHA) protein|nr:FHA domain-containing protein [Verrucomicrobiae bacterium]